MTTHAKTVNRDLLVGLMFQIMASETDAIIGSTFTIVGDQNDDEYQCESEERSNRGAFNKEELRRQLTTGDIKVIGEIEYGEQVEAHYAGTVLEKDCPVCQAEAAAEQRQQTKLVARQGKWIIESTTMVENARRMQREQPNDLHRRYLIETQRELTMLIKSPLGKQWQLLKETAKHQTDADCEPFIIDDACSVCGVDHSDICMACLGRGFHNLPCSEASK